MKKTTFTIALALAFASAMVSCGDKQEATSKTPAKQTEKKAEASTEESSLPNYRIIDMDSLMLKYNLSIDFNEQMIRMQNNFEEEEKKQTNSINAKGESIQKRLQAAQQSANPSEMESLQKEYENLQTMQAEAQQKLTKMGADIETAQVNNLKTVMDSVQNFLKDYATKHGYDAVFFSHAAPYANPALDVTDEVVEGLNARYNKVK